MGFLAYTQFAVTRCERCASYAAIAPPTPTCSFPNAAGQSVPSVSTASFSASGRPPRCHSRSTHTCFATPVGTSSPTMATTRAPCSTTSGTRTSSTPSGTPKWRPTGSRTFGGVEPERLLHDAFVGLAGAGQTRDDLRFPLDQRCPVACLPRQRFLDGLDGLDGLGQLLVSQAREPVGVFELHLLWDRQGEDLQVGGGVPQPSRLPLTVACPVCSLSSPRQSWSCLRSAVGFQTSLRASARSRLPSAMCRRARCARSRLRGRAAAPRCRRRVARISTSPGYSGRSWRRLRREANGRWRTCPVPRR